LVGDYDSWRHAQAPDCVYLNLYLQSKNASPEDAVWQGLAEHKTCLDKAIECGASMSLYKSGYCEMICDQFGYETELRGLKCFAVNMQRMGKHGFGRRAQQYDACIAYAHNGTHWVVSVYYDKPEVNCGEVCRWLGGGGHKGAAGFTCFHLPFRKNG
jgi:nanoRNase/pAp phosphatase (c-di-AMP/oligoRNAs hydrolase)